MGDSILKIHLLLGDLWGFLQAILDKISVFQDLGCIHLALDFGYITGVAGGVFTTSLHLARRCLAQHSLGLPRTSLSPKAD